MPQNRFAHIARPDTSLVGPNSEVLLDRIVTELQARMAKKMFRKTLAPLPFLQLTHRASPEYARELRCCLGISQTHMARLIEIGGDVLSRYERNVDGLGPHGVKMLEALGAKYAQTGERPEIPDQRFSGGGSSTRLGLSGPKEPKRLVPVSEALRDPGFAAKELGIGFAGGIVAVAVGFVLFVVLS